MDKEEKWSFYIIINNGYTYAGVSPDVHKRLRKHNNEITGGAKYTLSKGPGWKHVCLVHGFRSKLIHNIYFVIPIFIKCMSVKI